jgi:hypothetical protein
MEIFYDSAGYVSADGGHARRLCDAKVVQAPLSEK